MSRFLKLTILAFFCNSMSISFASQFIIEGQGVPRESLEKCTASISNLEKTLTKHSLQLIEQITCTGTQINNTAAFTPGFKAFASEDFVLGLVSGPHFNSKAYCEIERARQLSALEKKNIRTLDSGCQQQSETSFQPRIVILDKN